MIALLLTPVYILVMLYLLRWNIWWLIACSPFFKRKGFRIGYSCFFLALSLSPLFSFLITEPSLKWFFKHLSNYWLGTLLYILMIILLGDPDQIDRPFLDERTNGLSYASEHMKGSPLCWQITMTAEECLRSELAMDAIQRL